jgi:hypothetical protein
MRKLKAEMVEQCRIIGMGAERELRLLSEIERLERENKHLKAKIGAQESKQIDTLDEK